MCLIARSDPNNNTIVKRKKCHQDPLYALYLVLDLPLFRTRIWTVRSKVFKHICHFVLSAHGFFLFTCDTFTHCLIRLDKKRPAFLQESRRDQEEGGELDCQESPGEIKSREVSWTVKRVQARSRGGRWAGLSREPRRDQEQGGGAGLRKLDFFCFSCSSTAVLWTLSLWLLRTAVETAVA